MSRNLESISLLIYGKSLMQTIDIDTCEMTSRPSIIGCQRYADQTDSTRSTHTAEQRYLRNPLAAEPRMQSPRYTEARIRCIRFQSIPSVSPSERIPQIMGEYLDKYHWAAVCNLVFGNDFANCLDIRLVSLDVGVVIGPPEPRGVGSPAG